MNSRRERDQVLDQFDRKNKTILKEHVKAAAAHLTEERKDVDEDQCCQDTMMKGLPVSKIKLRLDEEETKKFGWDRKQSTQPQSDKRPLSEQQSCNQESANQSQEQTEQLEVPYNKRVEDILAKKPLRERIGGLLQPDQILPISFNHHQLLKRMDLIDRTIDFLQNHRNIKIFYFETIKKSIYETGNTFIEYRNFQQLNYLHDSCYEIEWKFNEKINRYDLKISTPLISSADSRKAFMRDKVVQFLKLEEQKFLAAKNLTKNDMRRWHPEFKYQEIQIPCKDLPVHPNEQKSDLKQIDNKDILKIANPNLKRLFQSKKKMEGKSISGASVADMIFSRVPTKDISTKIMQSIKEREKIRMEQQKKIKQNGNKIDKVAMVKICEQILLIFMGKNVSNIFKATLIEILQSRMKFKDDLIQDYLQKIISAPDLKFLMEIESSQKLKVLRIDRQKYRAARDYFSQNDVN